MEAVAVIAMTVIETIATEVEEEEITLTTEETATTEITTITEEEIITEMEEIIVTEDKVEEALMINLINIGRSMACKQVR